MAKTRRSYQGGAASTTTGSSIAASGATTFTITAYTGWPYGSAPFFVVVEPGTSNEEKILVTRTGATDTTINIYATPNVAANRGVDGTTAFAHNSASTIYPVFTALDADEANEIASTLTTQGDILIHGASTFGRVGIGTAAQVLKVNSGATAPEWGQVATAGIADDAVTAAKIAANAVGSSEIADSSVTSAKIANSTIVLGDLAAALQAFLVPVGTINAYGNATPPTGWLLCNGQSTTGYTALAAVVGATVPDLRGRTIIGTGTGTGLTARTINATGGAETHTLTTSELSPHAHTMNFFSEVENAQHTHNVTLAATPSGSLTTVAPSAGSGLIATGANTSSTTSDAQNATHQHKITGTTDNNGSGSAHNNMQPFYALNYIIKHD